MVKSEESERIAYPISNKLVVSTSKMINKPKINQMTSSTHSARVDFFSIATDRDKKAYDEDQGDQQEIEAGRRMKKMLFQDLDVQDQMPTQKNVPPNIHTQYQKAQKIKRIKISQQPQYQRQQGVNFINLNLNIQSTPNQQIFQSIPTSYPPFKSERYQGIDSISPLQVVMNMRNQKKVIPSQQQLIAEQLAGAASKFIKNQLIALQYRNTLNSGAPDVEAIEYTKEEANFKSIPEDQGEQLYTNSNNNYNLGFSANSSLNNFSYPTNNKPKSLLKHGQSMAFQVQEIIPINDEGCQSSTNRESKSPTQRIGSNHSVNNDQFTRVQCTHKHKPSKDGQVFSSLPHGLHYSQIKGINPWERTTKSGEQDYLGTQSEQFEKSGRLAKGKMLIESRRNNQFYDPEESRRGMNSSDKYDDTGMNPNKGKYSLGQCFNKINNLVESKGGQNNSNSALLSTYNGMRNEPSSHQFIALKNIDTDDSKLRSLKSQELEVESISENALKSSKSIFRQSLLPSIGKTHQRGASNGEQRGNMEMQSQDGAEYIESLGSSSQFGNNYNFIDRKKTRSMIRSDQNAQSPDQPSLIEQNSTFEIEPVQQAAPLQSESKKMTRKIFNAVPNSKQEPLPQAKKPELEKKVSAPNILKPKNSQPSSNAGISSSGNSQQKNQVQKTDQEIILSIKIKMYLDFQRIINFSNNMVIQIPPLQGLRIYKAFITKGNNGALIRAAVKSRWWWTLTEQFDDLENINFLWTQWRKPNFYKLFKSRQELAIQEAESDNIEAIADSTDEASSSIFQQGEDISNNNNTLKDNQADSEKGDQQDQSKNTPGGNLTNSVIELSQHSNQSLMRNGYNDDPLKSIIQDVQVKQPPKKSQVQSSPVTNRKASVGQLIIPNDPYAKISPLVNEKDLDIIKKFIKSQKQSRNMPNNYAPPPVFNKEEYENGIEKVYEQMRKEIGGDTKSIPTIFKIPIKQKMHNHMEFNFHLANKKALYYNMKQYYTLISQNVFDNLPVTFHIQHGLVDPEFANFVNFFNNFESQYPKRKNVWIIKPGESSNRGNGIQVAGDINTVSDIIKNRESHQNGFKKTYIIQQYLDRPFLYNKRKFDIRCFMLVTNYNNTMKSYWYQEGYIRTSTKEFTLKNLENRMIHLTNEAVQKRGDDFGKYENGNKLSYSDFQKYIDINFPKENYNFMQSVYPAMKRLAYDSVCSVYTKIDKKKRNFSFELFGLDFMIDDQFKTWLIEINTNPSLTIAAPIMARLLPGLVDNVLKIAIDPIFPPPSFPKSKKHLIPEQLYENNKFDLLFDSVVDGPRIAKLYQNTSSIIDEQLEEDCKNEEVYDDDNVDREEDEGGKEDQD